MKPSLDRRDFLKQSLLLSATALTGFISFPKKLFSATTSSAVDLSVITGTDPFNDTIKAVEALGGMSKFVHKGSKVGLLLNSPWEKPGTYTNPDVALALLKMCVDAGVGDIHSIECANLNYWKRSKLYGKYEKKIALIKSNSDKTMVKIEKGKSLKEAEIMKSYMDCDVVINVPIIKHHDGTHYTCTLKNIMGATSGPTNQFFHFNKAKPEGSWVGDVENLSQCIADANLIRKPDLCVVDATEFITTNGPYGPGKLKKANKIVAGVNRVSVDAYCVTLLDLNPMDLTLIRHASEHGLGEMDLKKLNIKEA